MLTCKICGLEKDDDEFDHFSKKGNWTITTGRTCKECKRIQKRNRNARTGPTYREKNRDKNIKNSKEWYWKNLQSSKDRNKKWAEDNPNSSKDRTLRSKHGISLLQYNEMLLKQNDVCAICIQPERRINNQTGKLQRLSVDHNHLTGKIRGLLCDDCNIAIGKIKENITTLENAKKYLEQHMEK